MFVVTLTNFRSEWEVGRFPSLHKAYNFAIVNGYTRYSSKSWREDDTLYCEAINGVACTIQFIEA